MKHLRPFLEAQHFIRVPLKRIKSNHYEIEVKVNGIPGIFILDTGASNSCIGIDSVSFFNLMVEKSEIEAAGAGATGMATQISFNNSLEILSWAIEKITFVVLDLKHVNHALKEVQASPVHGILGADVLKQGRAVIDYGRNCVYFK